MATTEADTINADLLAFLKGVFKRQRSAFARPFGIPAKAG
jgi:hypothetical protein